MTIFLFSPMLGVIINNYKKIIIFFPVQIPYTCPRTGKT